MGQDNKLSIIADQIIPYDTRDCRFILVLYYLLKKKIKTGFEIKNLCITIICDINHNFSSKRSLIYQ